MSASTTHSIPHDQFLTMAANLLYKALLDNSRTQAKNLYKDLFAGKVVVLTTVEMQDKSRVRFDIAMDHSEHRGSLNFGAFRSSLTQLIAKMGEILKKEDPVPVFSAQDDSGTVIFGVTAVTQEADNTNILVLSANMDSGQPTVLLKLMYLDHEQFVANSTGAA